MPVDGTEIILRNRKISTYINALASGGFVGADGGGDQPGGFGESAGEF